MLSLCWKNSRSGADAQLCCHTADAMDTREKEHFKLKNPLWSENVHLEYEAYNYIMPLPEKWQTQPNPQMVSIKQSLLLLTLFNWILLELQLIHRNFPSFAASGDSKWFYIKPLQLKKNKPNNNSSPHTETQTQDSEYHLLTLKSRYSNNNNKKQKTTHFIYLATF